MRCRYLFAFLLLVAPFAFADDPPKGSITIPLDEFDKLRSGQPATDLAVIDTLRLGGTFRDRNLTVAFIGRSIGKPQKIGILTQSAGLTIWSCSGAGAVVSRGGDASFALTATAPAFDVRCRIAAPGSDRMVLQTTNNVLAVESAASDGELVAGDASADGARAWSLVRLSGAGEHLPPTATGRYLLTLLPDETRFRYTIDVHNPNRAREPFDLVLQSGEHLQQVDADAPQRSSGPRSRSGLPPGDARLVLTGELRATQFVPPVDASVQYVVIESHPLLHPDIKGGARRISAAEAGTQTQFRGPQAFEVGKGERITWSVTRLEALHTTSYALSAASHTFFLPADGLALGESSFNIENQGASDLKLPRVPEPTYVSLDGDPLLLTKGSDGRVLVPLGSNKQQIVMQDRQEIRRVFGLGLVRLTLPQFAVPASSTMIRINFPRQWYPLVQTFSTRTRLWSPSFESMAVFGIMTIWSLGILAWLGVARRERIVLAIALGVACAASDPFAIVVGLALAVATVAWAVPHVKREKWTWAKAVLVALILICVAGLLLRDVASRRRYEQMMTTGSGGLGSVSEAGPMTQEMRQLQEEGRSNVFAYSVNAKMQQKSAGAGYAGLPAKFEVPEGERHSYFGQEMLSTDRTQSVGIVMVSAVLVWWLQALLVATAIVLAWRSRAAIYLGLYTHTHS